VSDPADPAAALADYLRLAGARSKGRRPWFFENRDAERVLGIAMALAQELSVTRDRLDTLERLLEQAGLLRRADIESYAPDAAAAAERGRRTQEYLAVLLRVVQQELEESEAGPEERSSEEVARELGGTEAESQ